MKTKNIIIVLSAAFLVTAVLLYYLLFLSPKNHTKININSSPIAIGILTSDEKVINSYQFFADYLSRYSGRKWHIVPVKDAGSFVEQIESHKIGSAIVGSAAGYRMIKNNLGIPVVREEKNGISTYRSYVIARKSSDIGSIQELKNKRFAYVDINTSSGYFFPVYLLKTKGYDADTFFRAMSFLGTDENVIQAVLSENFDGGAIKDLSWFDAVEKNPGIENKLRIIEEGGSYPNRTFILSIDFDEKDRANIENLLLNMPEVDEGKKVLKNMGIDRFINTDVGDFREVDKIMNQ